MAKEFEANSLEFEQHLHEVWSSIKSPCGRDFQGVYVAFWVARTCQVVMVEGIAYAMVRDGHQPPDADNHRNSHQGNYSHEAFDCFAICFLFNAKLLIL